MKKLLLFSIATLAFAYNVNQIYTCKTLGLSFKENNKTYNVPNNEKTQIQLKKTLKSLYSVKIKPENKQLTVFIEDKNDTLDFVKLIDNKVTLYKTKSANLFILTDPKSLQIGINIPMQKMIIYYQCK